MDKKTFICFLQYIESITNECKINIMTDGDIKSNFIDKNKSVVGKINFKHTFTLDEDKIISISNIDKLIKILSPLNNDILFNINNKNIEIKDNKFKIIHPLINNSLIKEPKDINLSSFTKYNLNFDKNDLLNASKSIKDKDIFTIYLDKINSENSYYEYSLGEDFDQQIQIKKNDNILNDKYLYKSDIIDNILKINNEEINSNIFINDEKDIHILELKYGLGTFQILNINK